MHVTGHEWYTSLLPFYFPFFSSFSCSFQLLPFTVAQFMRHLLSFISLSSSLPPTTQAHHCWNHHFSMSLHTCTEALTHNSHLSESRNPKEAILFSIAHVRSHTCEDNFLFDNDVQIKAKSFIFSFIFYFL